MPGVVNVDVDGAVVWCETCKEVWHPMCVCQYWLWQVALLWAQRPGLVGKCVGDWSRWRCCGGKLMWRRWWLGDEMGGCVTDAGAGSCGGGAEAAA